NSLSLKPTAGNAQNVTCDGIAINEGQTVNVAGAICNGMSLHGAGDLFAADITLINSTTISPCPENYVNCQADATSSYFLK
ncbi:MAG: hypothetical protein ACXWQE_07575, partial [Bdellovibrionales bacterium]